MALPTMRLDGKVALITGAAGGIGEAVTAAYAESGADCVVCELPERMDSLDALCEVVRGHGRKELPLPLEVRDLDNINSVVDATMQEMGRIDILVNSAGVNRPMDAFDVTEEDWDFILDINLKGLFFLCQRVGREMKEAGGGRIINMASIMGMVGYYPE